jgi:hypothetical protein
MFLIGVFLLAGCQTAPSLTDKAVMDQEAFDRYWGLYQNCRSADLATIPVRTPLWEHIAVVPSNLPVRLSAAPRALAADCAIHAGNLASMQGEQGLAVEFFSLVIARYQEPDYASYVARAWDGFLRTAPGITTVSARPHPVAR